MKERDTTMHFAWHENAGLGWLALSGEGGGPAPGIRGGLSTRSGGLSCPPCDALNLSLRVGDDPNRVAENLGRLARATGADLENAARVPLEHGARVHLVTSPGWTAPGDALVTRVPHLPLAITVADCYPLFLALPGAAALAHCGWRGTLAGVAPATLAALCAAAGRPPAEARAWIGPGIGPCCYDLPEEETRAFPGVALGPPRGEAPEAKGAPGAGVARAARAVDLAAWLAAQLIEAGVPAPSIATSGLCTACHAERFYSHRRDRGRTGRMLAWIELAR